MLETKQDNLLLGGHYVLCHRLVFFMNSRLNDDINISYRPIKSEDSRHLIKTFPKNQQLSDTVYLYRKGRSHIRSLAAIRCLLYLKWYWRIWFYILWLIPSPLRDLKYQFIAAYRYRIFKKPQNCIFRID